MLFDTCIYWHHAILELLTEHYIPSGIWTEILKGLISSLALTALKSEECGIEIEVKSWSQSTSENTLSNMKR